MLLRLMVLVVLEAKPVAPALQKDLAVDAHDCALALYKAQRVLSADGAGDAGVATDGPAVHLTRMKACAAKLAKDMKRGADVVVDIYDDPTIKAALGPLKASDVRAQCVAVAKKLEKKTRQRKKR